MRGPDPLLISTRVAELGDGKAAGVGGCSVGSSGVGVGVTVGVAVGTR